MQDGPRYCPNGLNMVFQPIKCSLMWKCTRDQRSCVAPLCHPALMWCSHRLQRSHAGVLWVSGLKCGRWCWVTHCFDCDWCHVYIKKIRRNTGELGVHLRWPPLHLKHVCLILKTHLFNINNILLNDSKYSWKCHYYSKIELFILFIIIELYLGKIMTRTSYSTLGNELIILINNHSLGKLIRW